MDRWFANFANVTAKVAGKPWTFVVCVAVVLIWAISGPLFGFSQTWQLVINTGTTIVTFLMVFLIQNTQNRDGAAMQAKLDELIHAIRSADERFIGIEHMTEKDLDKFLEEVESRAQRVHGDERRALPKVATRAEDALEAAEGKRRPATGSRRRKAAST